jgi:hypothetical protein
MGAWSLGEPGTSTTTPPPVARMDAAGSTVAQLGCRYIISEYPLIHKTNSTPTVHLRAGGFKMSNNDASTDNLIRG